MSYKELPGAISSRALSEHLKLFNGYEKMLKNADKQLEEIPKLNKSALDGDLAKSFRNHGYAVGGVDLHDLYFNNLSLTPSQPSDLFLKYVEDSYGSLKQTIINMNSAGLSCRGWVVLAQEPGTKKFRIFTMNSHDEGAAFGYNPVCVIDVWEHAYWMDWGTDKAGYLKALEGYIDWGVISQRCF